MKKIAFDIETLGFEIDSFDNVQQEYLTKYCENEIDVEKVKFDLSLWAPTSRVLAIAIYNPDTEGGKVFYQSDLNESFNSANGKVEFSTGDEKYILTEFWNIVKSFDQVITFNGRGFDAPFLIIRSAILGVPISKNLMPYRYDQKIHCDLLDQLSFYGATRKFNLDFFCKTFGIESPKSHGITGMNMKELVEKKMFREIAKYCLDDTIATAKLHQIMETNNFFK